MNRLLLIALAASLGISACSKKEEVAAPVASSTAPTASAALSGATLNTGKVLQVLQAGGYTYAEVDTQGGQKIWIAGAPIEVKAGDSVQWGTSAVMENFSSKTLGRTFERILFVNTWGPAGSAPVQMASHGKAPVATEAAPTTGQQAATASVANQGKVKSVANAAGYTYVEIDQAGTTVWVAAPETSVKPGDKVSWDNGMVMRNFAAKSLGRTFDQIIFAGKVAVVP